MRGENTSIIINLYGDGSGSGLVSRAGDDFFCGYGYADGDGGNFNDMYQHGYGWNNGDGEGKGFGAVNGDNCAR